MNTKHIGRRSTRRTTTTAAGKITLALLSSLILANAALNGFGWPSAHRPDDTTGLAVTPSGKQDVFRYIRMKQWQADARSVAAAIRYLLDPSPESPPGDTRAGASPP